MKNQSPSSVGLARALANGLDLLEKVAGLEGKPASFSELFQLSGLPRASFSRYLRLLTGRGYLSKDPESGLYGLGVRLIPLGRLAADGFDLRRQCRQYLMELSRESHERAELVIWDRPGILFLDIYEAEHQDELKITHGSWRLATLGGVPETVLIAHEPPKEQSRYIQKHLTRPDVKASEKELSLRLENCRKHGFAANFGTAVNRIFAPIYHQEGICVAALGLAVPAYRVRGKKEKLIRLVKQWAKEANAGVQA